MGGGGRENLEMASATRLRAHHLGCRGGKIWRLWAEPPEKAPARPSAAPWWLVTTAPQASCRPSPKGRAEGLAGEATPHTFWCHW